MVKRFLDFIRLHKLYHKDDKILLAVSGGVDSVVMCHLFNAAKLSFAIAHVNFGLRGQDSDDDANFVETLAHQYQIAFYSTTMATAEVAQENGWSIQMAARELRYAWFYQLLQEHNYTYIATAHHHNDSIETVILNLTKGTGIAGLHGILPRNEKITRPLLFATKDEIMAYALQCNLPWREDISNVSNKYQRNLIRNEVIPLLKKINPSLEATFKTTLEKLNYIEQLYHQEVEKFTKRLFVVSKDEIHIYFTELKSTPNHQILLAGALAPFGYSFTSVKNIFEPELQQGKTYLSKTHQIVSDHEKLILFTRKNPQHIYEEIYDWTELIQTPLETIEFRILEHLDLNVIKLERSIACLDYKKLTFPLVLRNWQHGDRIDPFGLNGLQKNVSDLLNDYKVPSHKKQEVLVLESNGNIAWVVGYRIAEKFKVDTTTQRYFFGKAHEND